MKMTCIIVEDEIPAQLHLQKLLQSHGDIQLLATCGDGVSAMKAIQEFHPDFLILDINLPKITGIELLELIENPPYTIFTTAYNEYAVKAFELNALDYLLKPFNSERFAKAIEKIKMLVQQQSAKQELPQLIQENLERVVVRVGQNIKIIPTNEILFIEAQDDYVMIYTKEGKFLKQQTMKYFEAKLNNVHFFRIHRSYIVHVMDMKRIEPLDKSNHILITHSGHKLPISRSGYASLKDKLDF